MISEGGYTGKTLRLNLSDHSYEEEKLDSKVAKNFVGGAGFGIRYLYEEVNPNCNPLGKENKLIFAPGPLTGTTAPCTNRLAITAKSPLTGGVGMSITGGYFPTEIKLTGYDIIIFEGASEEPVHVQIEEENIRFNNASKLSGTSTLDCQELIKRRIGKDSKIACIGPAGENLSKMAAIINERRAAGRKGLGAVMGAKNLKAISVKGNKNTIDVAKEDDFKKARQKLLRAINNSEALTEFSKYGTSMTIDVSAERGILPANNWQSTGKYPAEKIEGEVQLEYRVDRWSCARCPVRCSQVRMTKKGPYKSELSEGPEYETAYSLGPEVGVDYYPSIIKGDKLCDSLGLDTISTGVTIGFAMELFEREIIDKDDTDGIELKFGNHEAVNEMIEKIAYRDGFGDILADGSRIAAERIGEDSSKYAMHVKGLELPAYDVRGAKAHGLNYATAYTGADHNRGYAFQEIFGIPIPEEVDRLSSEGKGKLTKWNQDIRTSVCDCATLCVFLLDMAIPESGPEIMSELVSAATGLEYTPESYKRVGERTVNLARVFNLKAGFDRRDDTLPDRLMEEEIEKGGSKGSRITRSELNKMLDEYYRERGWTKEGKPTEEKLKELELFSAIKYLE